jgi:hypothetical protein
MFEELRELEEVRVLTRKQLSADAFQNAMRRRR